MSEQTPQYFRTVTEMHAVPAEKIDAFVEDLRLWLHMHRELDATMAELGAFAGIVKITSPTDAFGWLDDGKHDASIRITMHAESAAGKPE